MTIVKAFPWSYQHNKAKGSLMNTMRVFSVCPTLLKLMYTLVPGVPKTYSDDINSTFFLPYCMWWLVSCHIKKKDIYWPMYTVNNSSNSVNIQIMIEISTKNILIKCRIWTKTYKKFLIISVFNPPQYYISRTIIFYSWVFGIETNSANMF